MVELSVRLEDALGTLVDLADVLVVVLGALHALHLRPLRCVQLVDELAVALFVGQAPIRALIARIVDIAILSDLALPASRPLVVCQVVHRLASQGTRVGVAASLVSERQVLIAERVGDHLGLVNNHLSVLLNALVQLLLQLLYLLLLPLLVEPDLVQQLLLCLLQLANFVRFGSQLLFQVFHYLLEVLNFIFLLLLELLLLLLQVTLGRLRFLLDLVQLLLQTFDVQLHLLFALYVCSALGLQLSQDLLVFAVGHWNGSSALIVRFFLLQLILIKLQTILIVIVWLGAARRNDLLQLVVHLDHRSRFALRDAGLINLLHHLVSGLLVLFSLGLFASLLLFYWRLLLLFSLGLLLLLFLLQV